MHACFKRFFTCVSRMFHACVTRVGPTRLVSFRCRVHFAFDVRYLFVVMRHTYIRCVTGRMMLGNKRYRVGLCNAKQPMLDSVASFYDI